MPAGIACATLAYVAWGLFPLYFHALAAVPPGEVLLHRVCWSLAFLGLILAGRRQWAWLGDALRRPAWLAAFGASALLLSCNWLTYIWAVGNGHVIDASLGYFITPLVNVLLGCTVLKERLRPLQWTAVALAAAGVLWLAWQAGRPPWIALLLASSFGAYGLMRKTAPLGALEGLTLETLMLAPPALAAMAWLSVRGDAVFPSPDAAVNGLLVGVGPVTAVPLLLFAAGARRIPMSTLGLLQYLSPSLQLGLGIWLFGEPFAPARAAGFAIIWGALLLYSVDSWRAYPKRTA